MIKCARFLILACLLTLLGLSPALAGKITYIYTDQQNSPLIEADAQGNVLQRFDYKPYGGASDLWAPSNGPGYTGHVNDPETSLIYMQARYQDPAVGRFLSVDPVTPEPGDVFGFNRYAYARNNPYTYVDIDGRLPEWLAKAFPKGDLVRTTGEAIGADSAYLVGVATGNEPLKAAAVEGMEQNVAASDGRDALASLVLIGKGGASEGVGAASLIPGKGVAAGEAVQLTKQLASEGQMAELTHGNGTPVAGAGTGTALKQADRLASQYGGKAKDYQKVSSSAYTAADGSHVETHAYQSPQTGNMVIEPKTIINPGQK